MKKYIIFICTIIVCLFITSCDKKNKNLNGDSSDIIEIGAFTKEEEKIFEPSLPHDTFEKEMKEAFYQNEYYKSLSCDIISCQNFIPIDIAKKYIIGAFEVTFSSDVKAYFLWHNGEIVCCDWFNLNTDLEYTFINFALMDANEDGYFEFVSATNCYREREWKVYTAYVISYDSYSKKSIVPLPEHNQYLFLKEVNNQIAIYTSVNKDLSDGEFFSSFERTLPLFTFKQLAYEVLTLKYKCTVIIDYDTINYPIMYKGMMIKFKVKTIMTYLGRPFSYITSHGYKEGATVSFKRINDKITTEIPGYIEVVTKHFVNKNDIIEKDYQYSFDYESTQTKGNYNMIVSYRGSKVSKLVVLNLK